MSELNHSPLLPSSARGLSEISADDRALSISPDNISERIRAKVNHWIESLSGLLLKAGRQSRAVQIGIFLVILSPVLLLALFGCLVTYIDLTESTFSKRQAVAQLAATAIEHRFGRLTDIGVSLATGVPFRQLVSKGQWQDAVDILKDVPRNFTFVDRVILFDTSGTLMAHTLGHLESKGKNFATRDWHRGVSKWQPYISDVYQRATEPRYNMIDAAIPIQAVGDDRVNGVLLLQVQLDRLIVWNGSFGASPSVSIYFIDRKGQVATHAKSFSDLKLVDYSSVPVVQKLLRGESGVAMMRDPLENDERIAAYAPVAGLGWGVIASEAAQSAFARRNRTLTQLIVLYSFILFISGMFVYIIWRTLFGLKKAEAEIQTLNHDLQNRAAELEATNRELESFSYSVSHDLRAPLRAIDGFSQALLEDYAGKIDAAGKDFLDRIRAASQRMAQLIDDLLNLARLSRSAMTRAPVNLSGLAQNAVAELHRAEPERPVECTIAENLRVDGDQRLLRIVLDNLIGNAWKFTAKTPQPKIEFGTASKDGATAYFVRDNGAGFNMAHVDKLFGPFQRLHAMHEFKGTGIGLATVQRIIRRHGGRVWAEGQVGEGATFYFTLN